MTFPAKSNMYEVNAMSTLAVYGEFVQGSGNELLLVVSSHALGSAPRGALEASAGALGYGARRCAYALTQVCEGELDAALGASDLLSVVEGLDPLAVVAADAEAAALLGRAYRCELALDAATRVMGRTVVAFRRFEDMLSDPGEKQKAWALLKKIPKLG